MEGVKLSILKNALVDLFDRIIVTGFPVCLVDVVNLIPRFKTWEFKFQDCSIDNIKNRITLNNFFATITEFLHDRFDGR